MILKYYYAKKNGIELVIFNKYTIDTNGNVVNKETGSILSIQKNQAGYNNVYVQDDSKKSRNIRVARAMASTFHGPPPSPKHTADHKDKNPNNDTMDNIRWLCKKGQRNNQDRSETHKSALVVVKDGEEKTAQEWEDYLKGEKNSFGRNYTKDTIKIYARNKQFGFSYKEYPNLSDEVWKEIEDSENSNGRWEISNMNRVKYITKYAENALSGDRLGLNNEYPEITINGKHWKCHILAFMTFFPDEYATKKPEEIILHENDDRSDFRPHKLRLGTQSQNMKDAYGNGKHDGTKSAQVKCASYVNGVLEKEHVSKREAAKYLTSIGYDKATDKAIDRSLSGDRKSAYGRTWKRI